MKSIPLVALLLLAVGCSSTPEAHQPSSRLHGPLPYDGTVLCVLSVGDVNAAKAWYGKVLGCTVVYELPEHNWAEVATPTEGALIGLMQDPDATTVGNGGSSVSFGVRDISAAKASLMNHSVAIDGDVIEIPGVVKLLNFKDPYGNSLMLYQPLMAEAQKPK